MVTAPHDDRDCPVIAQLSSWPRPSTQTASGGPNTLVPEHRVRFYQVTRKPNLKQVCGVKEFELLVVSRIDNALTVSFRARVYGRPRSAISSAHYVVYKIAY